ncbi:MAG: tRNA preQ1(34) S-adenosylmethionine ribosyltransferase-isomerase QueA [Kiritimatiellae bacterium]|nr:tRNA preQ1(34) S-adenosylmethionine ribosyltransferase-isomerase QueA [Kiritimatiellia bacterium]
MKTRQFWYPLPTRLIAQRPVEKRGTDRMMVLHRDTGVIEHRHIADIVEYLDEKDLLVVNDTKVFPARLLGTWSDSPGAVEVLMVAPATDADALDAEGGARAGGAAPCQVTWSCMIGSGRPSREGQVAVFGPGRELAAELVQKLEGGMWRCTFRSARPLTELLDEFGRTPVPPYVHRDGTPEEEAYDRERYQTIYARVTGSVAAPTAGLHFTPEIFAALEAKGVKRAAVTLHVGPGTFRPVKTAEIEDHHMDFEAFTVPPETAEAIRACRARGGRVVCVGSTTVRTLETVAAAHGGEVVAGSGASNIFIYPPYKFAATGAMLTNFHLPQSTLLMMVSALAGRERILCAYALAVRAEYRFFSYGDCMLIV